jgi:hypothetical protein
MKPNNTLIEKELFQDFINISKLAQNKIENTTRELETNISTAEDKPFPWWDRLWYRFCY